MTGVSRGRRIGEKLMVHVINGKMATKRPKGKINEMIGMVTPERIHGSVKMGCYTRSDRRTLL